MELTENLFLHLTFEAINQFASKHENYCSVPTTKEIGIDLKQLVKWSIQKQIWSIYASGTIQQGSL